MSGRLQIFPDYPLTKVFDVSASSRIDAACALFTFQSISETKAMHASIFYIQFKPRKVPVKKQEGLYIYIHVHVVLESMDGSIEL